jgi:PIN domain nuclease of toxin-antitoxin system
MSYLVDTHVLLWSFFEPARLSNNIKSILLNNNNSIYYSPINLWEISIKYGLGKLKLNGSSPEDFFNELEGSFFLCKELRGIDIVTNYKLPLYHKDPFDRFLIWDAIQSNMVLITADKTCAKYKKSGLNLVLN